MAQMLRFSQVRLPSLPPLRNRRSASSREDRIVFKLLLHDLRFLARERPAAIGYIARYVHGFVLDTLKQRDNN